MKDDPIPAADHVARYCPASKLDEEGSPGPDAFVLRDGEASLSVFWLEYRGAEDRPTQLGQVRHDVALGLTMRPSARLAILNVGRLQTAVRAGSVAQWAVTVTHQPRTPPDSHSGVFCGDPVANWEVIAARLAVAASEVHPAVPPPA